MSQSIFAACMRRPLIFAACLSLITLSLHAQDGMKFQQEYRIHITKAVDKVVIDGEDREESWRLAPATDSFWQKWPNDKIRPRRDTKVRMTYDEHHLYVFAIVSDTNHWVIPTLKRDMGFFSGDAFSVAIDPVNSRTNGFLFSVNPYNVQTDDLVSASTSGDLNFSWDNKWLSETKRYPDHWTVEMAIPFKTLRYRPGKDAWGINFLRADRKSNQFSAWTKMPMNFAFYDFGYSGALVWDQAPPTPGTNIAVVPYVTGGVSQDKENQEGVKGRFNAGFDAKVAVTSSLNLDLTVNPDFSQVEVDQQVTNLTRFSLFFPERRTFFLENDDLFSSYGIPPIRPFYSRTIGLDKNGNTIPIAGGARLTGNLTKSLRIGVMNMQTLAKDGFNAQNYTAITFNQRVQKRSSIKGYFLNRQALDPDHKITDPLDAFGRNAGLQYDFSSASGKWSTWTGLHGSFKEGIEGINHYINVGGQYSTPRVQAVVDMDEVTDKYYADMGFIERIENYDAKLDTVFRKGFRQVFTEVTLKRSPTHGKVAQRRIGWTNYAVFNLDGSLNETTQALEYNLSFKNTSFFLATAEFNHVNLLYHTRFTDDKYDPLPPGAYSYVNGQLMYESDNRKKFLYTAGVTYGGFYNGKILRYEVSVGYRAQPWGNFSVSVQNANLEFPGTYGKTNLFLIQPRVEVNFSNRLFWTTFIQFNNQNNNLNFNSRLQWRYKPMSDLYLVYTDNYYTDPLFKNKNRAIVFKMNYWLNL